MKIIFYNKKGEVLFINNKLPETAEFAEINLSLVVYEPSSKKKYILVLDWVRKDSFPKNSVFRDSVSNIKNLLKE